MTNKHGLLTKWRQFEEQCPEQAKLLRGVIGEMYEKLHDKKPLVCGDIEQLRKLAGNECVRKAHLISNTSDQGLAVWALTMGTLFLSDAERKLK